jgi:hypothetical protein
MARYDSRVIYVFADELYARAEFITIVYTAIGGLIGAVLGYIVSAIGSGGSLLTTLIGLAIVGAFGYFIGSGQAFELRLQAQTLLCQVAIEENTRKLPESVAVSDRTVPSSSVVPTIVSSSSGHKCRECGAELPRHAEFCPKCLAPVS